MVLHAIARLSARKSAGKALLADAAYLAGGDKYRIGFGLRHEVLDRFGVPQIKLVPGRGDYPALFAL